jgi:hypothetical protein
LFINITYCLLIYKGRKKGSAVNTFHLCYKPSQSALYSDITAVCFAIRNR